MQVTGHIRKRDSKDNRSRYQLIIELPRDDKSASRKRIYKTIDGTKKYAEKMLRVMMDEIENNEYVKTNNITVGRWIEEWFNLYISTKSPSTQRGYRVSIDNHILPRFENVILQELTTIDVQRWVNDLYVKSPVTGKPLSEKTVRNIFLNLQSCCEKAVRLKMIQFNPCSDVELKACKKYEATVYTKNEVDLLVEAIKGETLEIPVLITLFLGLRRGELLALHWSDIDFEEKTVDIRRNLVIDKNRKIIEKLPKSKSGIRKLPLSDNLISLLKKYRASYLENRLHMGAKFKDNDYIFCNEDGSPINPDSFSSMYRNLLERNGLKHIRFHDLRHTSCTLLLSGGVSLKTLQKRLGHSDYSTTANIYSHVLTSDEVNASTVADNIVFSNQGIVEK